MKTEFTRLPALLLGGVSYYGDPFSTKEGWDAENEIGKAWQRFMALRSEVSPSACDGDALYEVHIYGAETQTKGYFEVFVGGVARGAQLPVALSTKYIPASEYLKITLSGKEITADWWLGLEDMIAASGGYTRKTGYILQAYDARFLGMDQIEGSVMDVFIPVEKNHEHGSL